MFIHFISQNYNFNTQEKHLAPIPRMKKVYGIEKTQVAIVSFDLFKTNNYD